MISIKDYTTGNDEGSSLPKMAVSTNIKMASYTQLSVGRGRVDF